MTKKKDAVEETLNEALEASAASIAVEVTDYRRETALQIALQHHKINGGMLTVQQLIENAKLFHNYIQGE